MSEQDQVSGQDRRSLAPAFTDHVQGIERGRAGPVLLAAALVMVLAAAGAFGYGVLTRPAKGHGALAAPSARATVKPVRAAAAADFTALSGYGCRQSPRASFTEAGWYADGLDGFIEVPAGGWHQQGCDGGFDAMPMSGSATQPDPTNYALWTFHLDTAARSSCRVAVYVPDDHSNEHVGGNPAQYLVYDAATASGTPAGSFTINQTTGRGSWAAAGTFRVPSGVLTVKLISSGLDWYGNVVTYAHIAVSQVRLSCTG